MLFLEDLIIMVLVGMWNLKEVEFNIECVNCCYVL